MNLYSINQKHELVTDLLSKQQVKKAFDVLEALLRGRSIPDLSLRLEELEKNYKLMLRYITDGINDPERSNIYDNIIESTFRLAEDIKLILISRFTQSITNSSIETSRDIPSIIEEFLMSDEEDEDKNEQYHCLREELFMKCFNITYYSNDDLVYLTKFFNSQFSNSIEQQLLISALLCNSLKRFDDKIFNMLCDLCSSTNYEICRRSQVAILIILYVYDSRLKYNKNIVSRVESLMEDHSFRIYAEDIILRLIASQDTERVVRTMLEEIIPEMIKVNPNMNNKLNFDDLLKDANFEDFNPDWEALIKDAESYSNKIEKMTELSENGADILMGAFSEVRSVPFFKKLSNWFLPFYASNRDLTPAINSKLGSLIKYISKNTFMCHSDRYCYSFIVLQVPESYQERMAKRISEELKVLNKISDRSTYTENNIKNISKLYIQDLYRFFKLGPENHVFFDIFRYEFDFHNKNFGKILLNVSALERIANYYFTNTHYNKALSVYNTLIEKEPQNVTYLQKAAYCLQKTRDYQHALTYFLKANEIKPNSYWNIRNIALCYRNLGMDKKSLKYYYQAEHIQPDNTKNQIAIGYCLLKLEKYEEALSVFFKLEYLGIQNIKIWRPIVWCSFILGKHDQAQRYSEFILKDKPNLHDFINRGHIEWVLGSVKEAIQFYIHALYNYPSMDIDTFILTINTDKEFLLAQGINSEDIPLIMDQLSYKLYNK